MRLTGKLVSATILLAAMTVLPAFGAEGRLVISKSSVPFTIDGVRNCPLFPVNYRDNRPTGHWIVTENLAAATGPVITISMATACPAVCANGICTLPNPTGQDVDLDLNGFNLRQTGNFPVIDVVVPPGSTGEVKIHNGAILGGSRGIKTSGCRKLVLEDLTISDSSGHGIDLFSTRAITIRNIVITEVGGAGMLLNIFNQATVTDNHIWDAHDGIHVIAAIGSVAITNNRISFINVGDTGGNGIVIESSRGVLIAENTIQGVTGQMGIFLRATTKSRIVGNVLASPITQDGIRIASDSGDNMISHNVASGMTRNGIGLSSRNNVIEGNLLTSNANGLVLDVTSANNVYRGNIARNNNGNPAVCGAGACANRTDFCNNGVGNTSQGDNFMPAIANVQACEK